MTGAPTRIVVVVLGAFSLGQAAFAFRSTDVDRHTDPDYKQYRATKVVLLVAAQDLELRRDIESRMISALKDHGVEAVRQIDLFPPDAEMVGCRPIGSL
jgi:hypothetical protein